MKAESPCGHPGGGQVFGLAAFADCLVHELAWLARTRDSGRLVPRAGERWPRDPRREMRECQMGSQIVPLCQNPGAIEGWRCPKVCVRTQDPLNWKFDPLRRGIRSQKGGCGVFHSAIGSPKHERRILMRRGGRGGPALSSGSRENGDRSGSSCLSQAEYGQVDPNLRDVQSRGIRTLSIPDRW